jgi:hypothetical protein
MGIKKEPFTRYRLEGEKPKDDIVPVYLSKEDRAILEEEKKFLRQPKDSTALKQLFIYGHLKLIGEPGNRYIMAKIIKNEYLNRKSGAFVESPKEEESSRNPQDS